jgi:hypothetical protein
MPLAPLILEAITPTPVPVQSIFIAGVDVNNQKGVSGNGYYVPVGSIEVDEQGPGGVSTMTFDLVDPLAVGPVPHDGDEVQFWNNATGTPNFGGFVSHWTTRVLLNGQGRITSISCVGFETILDWALLPADLVIPANRELYTAAQSIAANVTTTGPLNRASGAGPSAQAIPISIFSDPVFGGVKFMTHALTIPAGTSFREALRMVSEVSRNSGYAPDGVVPNQTPANPKWTIDFYRGLRGMDDSLAGSWATDYANATVTDTVVGANAADTLEHETDATQIVRAVFVKGANAAGTGYLSDGSGKPGRTAYVEDSTIDTAAKLRDSQLALLDESVIATRGSFDLVDWTPTAGVRPGSLAVLTDAQANATGTYRIYQITKRFLKSGRETWSITYGGLPPSVNRLIRRLTRATRS